MNWVDTSFLVYGFVAGHPAEELVLQELDQGEWGSTVSVLLEVYQVLFRDYRVAPDNAAQVTERLAQLALEWVPLDVSQAVAATSLRARHRVDSADAILLLLAIEDRGTLVSLDEHLLATGQALGLAIRNPITAELAAQIAHWEADHLPAKGLARILTSVERWLQAQDEQLAARFFQATNRLTALPL
jgi:predicted nucleic acid-binding protein